MQEAYNGAISALNEYNSNTQTELAGQSENLNSQLSELVSERITSAQQIGSQMLQILQEGAQNATIGMESATVSFQEKLTTSINQAIADLTNVDQQFRSQVETTHNEAISALSQIVDDGLKSEDNLIADARQELSATVGQIAGKYQQLKTEAESRSAASGNTPATRILRGIWGSITSFFGNLVDKVKKWFADTFGEFWGGYYLVFWQA
jgi:phage-related minor tail protein